MERRVLRVTAVIDERLRSLVLAPDGSDLLGSRVRLAEVNAQAALSVVDLLHVSPPF